MDKINSSRLPDMRLRKQKADRPPGTKRVGAGRNGKQPQEMYTVSVSAEGTNMDRDDILPALEDKLSNEIVKAVKP